MLLGLANKKWKLSILGEVLRKEIVGPPKHFMCRNLCNEDVDQQLTCVLAEYLLQVSLCCLCPREQGKVKPSSLALASWLSWDSQDRRVCRTHLNQGPMLGQPVIYAM